MTCRSISRSFSFCLPMLLVLAAGCDSSLSPRPTTDGDAADAEETAADADTDEALSPDGEEQPTERTEDVEGDAAVETGEEAPEEAAPPDFSLSPAHPPVAPVAVPYQFAFSAAGGTPPYHGFVVAKGGLPEGLTLDADTGTLSGTPTAEGMALFVIAAQDSAGATAKELFGLRIGDPAVDGPMARRAAQFQEIYLARHLWHGIALNAMRPDDPDGNYQLSTYGDCMFQNGTCLLGQSFRYAVIGGDEAAGVVKQQVDALRFFQNLTGVPGLIGRGFAHKDDPSEDRQWGTWYPESNKHKGTGEFADWYWQGDTSRDQVTGAVLGVAMAYDLAADPAVKQTARDFLVALADHVWDNGLKLVDPDGEVTKYGDMDGEWWEGVQMGNGQNAVCLLAWFKIAHHVSGEQRFADYYHELLVNRDYKTFLRENQWVYMGVNTKYYNVYMSFENWFHLMRLEEDPALRKEFAEIFRDTLWLNTDDVVGNRKAVVEKNAMFTPWYMYTTGDRDPEVLYDAVLQLVEFPEAPLRDHAVKNSEDPAVVKNPKIPGEALEAMPYWRREHDMVVWHRTPYNLDGGSDSGEERTGCDYLTPYFMGRYYGFISGTW